MTTPLFLLRCVQLGIHISELDLLTVGMVNDMYAESRNDEYRYATVADQAAMDSFDRNDLPRDSNARHVVLFPLQSG